MPSRCDLRIVAILEQRVEGKTRRQAEQQARRVAWRVLLESRKLYIEWEAFTLWVRAIAEAEQEAPEWLCRTVEARCPGLVSTQGKLWKCLDRWKHATIFAKPNREGWMRAVSFYAVRDLGYARNWAYWECCESLWSAQPPLTYPSFEAWKSASENCPDEVVDASGLRPDRKEMVKAARRAGRERFEGAVETYVELDALACWLRPILEGHLPLPACATDEIKRRYPVLRVDGKWNWDQLWDFLEGEHFQEAQAEGWFDAVAYTARLHPRRMKVIDYCSCHWNDHWPKSKPLLYPAFEVWRRQAERYRHVRAS
jgi:hypothetical protein